MDAGEFAAGDGEIAGFGGAAAEDDGIEIAAEFFDFDVVADVGVGDELDALLLHDLDAAIDEALFELKIGDAVHKKTADAVGTLEDGDFVASFV